MNYDMNYIILPNSILNKSNPGVKYKINSDTYNYLKHSDTLIEKFNFLLSKKNKNSYNPFANVGIGNDYGLFVQLTRVILKTKKSTKSQAM